MLSKLRGRTGKTERRLRDGKNTVVQRLSAALNALGTAGTLLMLSNSRSGENLIWTRVV